MDIFIFDFPRFEFSSLELGFLAMFLVAFAIQLYYYLRYFRGIIRKKGRIKKGKVSFETAQPPVSVVICARDEEDNLRQYLPLILAQDYPDYEVIVVDDGSYDNTEDYLSLMVKEHSHLKTSFVPKDAKNLSTKKLGLTIGIKAAKNDLLLFTDADCMPEGNQWIAKMVRNFHSETEFVLGYGGYLPKKGFLNKLIKYDTLFIAIQYMGMALAKRPYMAVGRNMAYRKETFFNLKGFASTLNLISGDDDLMVQRGSNRTNTEVEISHESVTWSEPKRTFSQWYTQKVRHLSVASRYNSGSKLRLAMEPASRALFYAGVILTVIFGNWFSLAAAVFFFLMRWMLLQMLIINKSAKQLGERRFYFTIPLFDIFLPMLSLYILIFEKNKKIRWK